MTRSLREPCATILIRPVATMAAEVEVTEHDQEAPQQVDFGDVQDWDAPGEPGDLSSLSAQTEWLNQQPMVQSPPICISPPLSQFSLSLRLSLKPTRSPSCHLRASWRLQAAGQ